ncbi:MAG: hypothetical protein ACXWC9_01125, partial [Pseudobdellovibrionaceae bacterium]
MAHFSTADMFLQELDLKIRLGPKIEHHNSMQRKYLSKLIRIVLNVTRLANGPTNVAGFLISLAIAIGAPSAQAVEFSQAYMTAEAVTAFHENPTMANFAKIDGDFQTLVLAEIRSMT